MNRSVVCVYLIKMRKMMVANVAQKRSRQIFYSMVRGKSRRASHSTTTIPKFVDWSRANLIINQPWRRRIHGEVDCVTYMMQVLGGITLVVGSEQKIVNAKIIIMLLLLNRTISKSHLYNIS